MNRCRHCGVKLSEKNSSGYCHSHWGYGPAAKINRKSMRLEMQRAQTRKRRTCLMCDRSFASTGAGNRRCPRCQTRIESPSEADGRFYEPRQGWMPCGEYIST